MSKVAVVGAGAIGRPVIEALHAGSIKDTVAIGVVSNTPPGAWCPAPVLSLADAITASDVIVECADQAFVSRHGSDILEAGLDLLVVSAGALADRELASQLAAAGPGRMVVTAGAIGGADLLASVAAYGPIQRVSVTTTKLPRALLQPWMDEQTQEQLTNLTEPRTVFEGSAEEAARFFPRSLNVAATLGLVVGEMDLVRVQLLADPSARLTSHIIEVDAAAGSYRFEIRNRPSPDNPRTSGVVSQAVLRTLSVLVGRPTNDVQVV